MKVSGHGGYWMIADALGLPTIVVHNSEYTVVTEVVLRETRSMGCGGASEGLPKYRRVAEAILRVAEDDFFFPQALGMVEGAELTVWLRRGSTGTFDKLTNTVVESVRVTNPQDKARRVEIVCRHGVFQRGVPPPAHPRTPAPAADQVTGEEEDDDE